jgi:hypothetical protein
LPVEGEVQAHAFFRERRVELQEGVAVAVVLACPLHDPLETPTVLRVDHDDHVAPAHGLCDQAGQGHALARLGGADQQRATFEILQWPVQGVLVRFDAMNEGQSDLLVGLLVRALAQEALGPWRHRVGPEVDLGQLVEPLCVQRLPLEAEPQEDLRGLAAQARQLDGADDLDTPSAEGGAQAQHPHGLRNAPRTHGHAAEPQHQRRQAWHPGGQAGGREVQRSERPRNPCPGLVRGPPRHLVAAGQHGAERGSASADSASG